MVFRARRWEAHSADKPTEQRMVFTLLSINKRIFIGHQICKNPLKRLCLYFAAALYYILYVCTTPVCCMVRCIEKPAQLSSFIIMKAIGLLLVLCILKSEMWLSCDFWGHNFSNFNILSEKLLCLNHLHGQNGFDHGQNRNFAS